MESGEQPGHQHLPRTRRAATVMLFLVCSLLSALVDSSKLVGWVLTVGFMFVLWPYALSGTLYDKKQLGQVGRVFVCMLAYALLMGLQCAAGRVLAVKIPVAVLAGAVLTLIVLTTYDHWRSGIAATRSND